MIALLADVAPPPPEIPIVDLMIPHPLTIVVVGLCVAAALAGISLRLEKPEFSSRWNWPVFAAIAVVILTIAAALWSAGEYRQAEERRGNWRNRQPPPPPQRPAELPEEA